MRNRKLNNDQIKEDTLKALRHWLDVGFERFMRARSKIKEPIKTCSEDVNNLRTSSFWIGFNAGILEAIEVVDPKPKVKTPRNWLNAKQPDLCVPENNLPKI